MNFLRLTTIVASSLILASCAEHELCEKSASARARTGIAIEELRKPNGFTMENILKAQQVNKESLEISKEILARDIKCNKK
jgi:hypothetical protein